MTVKDILYQETDDTCALCGQTGKENLTIHHIDGNPSNNVYDNQIVLCRNCHCRYHESKGITKNDIISRKKHLIEKTLTKPGVAALKIAYRNKFGVSAIPFLVYHLVDMGYISKVETIEWVTDDARDGKEKEVESNVLYAITEEGKRIYEKWLK
jgi:hypothetical protein